MAKKLDIEKLDDEDEKAPLEVEAIDPEEEADHMPLEIEAIPSKKLDIEPIDESDEISSPQAAPVRSDKEILQDKIDRFTGKKPVDSRLSVSDSISKLLGQNEQDLEAAKKQRDSVRLIAMLNRAGETFNVGANPLSGRKVDDTFSNNLMAQANQPIEDLNTKVKLGQESLKSASLSEEVKKQLAKGDPQSDISKVGRTIAQQAADSAKLNIKIPDGISMTELEKLVPGIENMANRRLQQDTLLASKQASSENQKTTKANQALGQTQQLLESARGNPAAQQAERDLYSASKAKSLINLYGDPNKLSPEMVATLVSEVAKISGGGAPTLEGMKALTPDTLNSKLARAKEFLMNKPSAASAGQFIKQYEDYVDKLTDDAKKVIKDKYGRIIESRKNALGDEGYQSLKDTYLNRFESPEGANASPKFDQDVIDYASKHGITPEQAQQIKMQRTQGQ